MEESWERRWVSGVEVSGVRVSGMGAAVAAAAAAVEEQGEQKRRGRRLTGIGEEEEGWRRGMVDSSVVMAAIHLRLMAVGFRV